MDAAFGRFAGLQVSGDFVVVARVEKTREPSPNSQFSLVQHAQLVDAVNKARPQRLFIDFIYERREADRNFPQLAAAVRRMNDRVVLAVEAKSARPGETKLSRLPSPAFGTAAQIARSEEHTSELQSLMRTS